MAYANKKIRENYYSMVNTTYNSKQERINKLQQLKGNTKLKLFKNLSHYYYEINIRNFEVEEELFSINAQGISKKYREVILVMSV